MTGAETDIVASPRVTAYPLEADGPFPNNPALALLVYAGAFRLPESDPAGAIERLFEAKGWPPAWRFGVFDFHHYHSTAHEVLGAFSGSARLQFGGPAGVEVAAEAGDAIVIPAGVAHKCLSAQGFRVVGAYPRGQDFDMNRGEPGERPAADHHIAAVPLPDADPVLGADGPLLRHWAAQG
ncbi:hypothetical protein [Thiohalorhabdus sp.]|uniref:hypothetical protein n=1 Tax=Thiohalorhabdus sp. TaxID=3094134 RepID=UPI002FC2CE49